MVYIAAARGNDASVAVEVADVGIIVCRYFFEYVLEIINRLEVIRLWVPEGG
jgi:hypothetical protein